MTALAPTLEAFFTCRLINEKGVSPHTIAAYRDTFRLLLCFLQQQTGKQPSRLDFEDLDAASILAFLEHLETVRHNRPKSRNARLAARAKLMNINPVAPARTFVSACHSSSASLSRSLS